MTNPADWPRHLLPYLDDCPSEMKELLRTTLGGVDTARATALRCRCGETNLLVGVAFNWEVVDAACPACGHEFSIYDPKHHGSTGARGKNDYARPPFESVPFGCMCRMMSFQIGVGLVFGPDRSVEDGETFAAIAIAGRCSSCGMTNLVLDAACD